MKILVFNGSPKKERSDTMHITRAFLGGMNEVAPQEVQSINVADMHIEFCRGCFACKYNGGRYIVVIHDDMDLEFGRIKVKAGGSAGGHNGIKSIDRSLGTPKYARVRMGVGHSKRGANAHDNTVNWVLGGFGPDQRKQLPEFLADGADAAEDIIFHGLAKTQEKFNGR